jgi:hypothetical protein
MTVLDADGRLTEAYREAVAAAIPTGVDVPDAFWADLQEIIVGFKWFRARHTSYPIAAERQRWKRIGNAVETLRADLRRLRRETSRTDSDAMWCTRALKALLEVQDKVKTRAAYHASWAAFSGQQDPHKEFLYWGVLRCWTDRLDRNLGTSRSSTKGTVEGPLIRYLTACLAPVLGDEMVRPRGLAHIIHREKKCRAHTEREKRWLRATHDPLNAE